MVSNNALPNMEMNPKKGRIFPDNSEKIELSWFSKKPEEILDASFEIRVRGGKTITVPVSVKVIIPQVITYEDDYNFGVITYGNTGVLQMTLENTSPIDAILNLDMREFENNPETEGISNLKIEQIMDSDDDTIVIEEKELDEIIPKDSDNPNKLKENENLLDKNDISFDNDADLSQDSFIQEENEESKYFQMILKANRVYRFKLSFCPLQPKSYKFYLPLTLEGYGKIDTVSKKVISCHGIAPKFLIEPLNGTIEFKKKTISNVEAPIEDTQVLYISNPDKTNVLHFYIDTSKISVDHTFNLCPNEGEIEPFETQEIK